MKCPNCGSDVTEGARFCDTCGAPMVTTPETPAVDSTNQGAIAPDAIAPDAITPDASIPDATNSNIPAADTMTADASVSDASIPEPTNADLSDQIPDPSPVYGSADPVSPPVEPAPQRVLHYEVVTPADGGMKPSSMGLYSLVLGIIGIIFSCVGCGGILSVIGLITGYLSLKTTSRQNGIIGIVLSALGLIIAIVVICIGAFAVIASFSSQNRGY